MSMFQIQTLTIPSNRLAAVNRRFPARLAAIHTTPRRLSSIRCRSATVEDFAACSVVSRNPASLYEVLKVKRNASPTDIKKAYRRLAKLYHPDANSTAVKKEEPIDSRNFIEIHTAYATLSDPKARAVYDCSIGLGAKKMVVGRSVTSTTSFGGYSAYSSSPRSSPCPTTSFGGYSSSPRSTTSVGGYSSSTRSTTSFSGCSSSSPRFSPRYSIRSGREFNPTRRWESDQCW